MSNNHEGPNTCDKVIRIACADIGYLEKSAEAYRKNPDVIWNSTAGAGYDNITKFGYEMHQIYPEVMDFPAPWCDAFVDWCFYKAYGVTTAKSLLGGNFDDYTVASAQMYKNHGALDENPALGAQAFFTKNGQVSGCYHTGLVCAVDGTYFYTIEGNTSGASGVVANGGGVAKKKYSIAAYRGKVLFGHPKYDVVGHTSNPDPVVMPARLFDKKFAGKYKLTSKAGYTLRTGPSKNCKHTKVSLGYGDNVDCYGYYSTGEDGKKWMYVCWGPAKKIGYIPESKVKRVK